MQQTCRKRDKARPGGKGEIVQQSEIWPYYQMVYGQTSICPTEWDTKNSLGFCHTNWSPIPHQKTRFLEIINYKRTWHLVHFSNPAE